MMLVLVIVLMVIMMVVMMIMATRELCYGSPEL